MRRVRRSWRAASRVSARSLDLSVSIVNTNSRGLLLAGVSSRSPGDARAEIVVLDNASEDGSRRRRFASASPMCGCSQQEFRAGFGANHNTVIV